MSRISCRATCRPQIQAGPGEPLGRNLTAHSPQDNVPQGSWNTLSVFPLVSWLRRQIHAWGAAGYQGGVRQFLADTGVCPALGHRRQLWRPLLRPWRSRCASERLSTAAPGCAGRSSQLQLPGEATSGCSRPGSRRCGPTPMWSCGWPSGASRGAPALAGLAGTSPLPCLCLCSAHPAPQHVRHPLQQVVAGLQRLPIPLGPDNVRAGRAC